MPSNERAKRGRLGLAGAAAATILLFSCRLFEYSPYVVPLRDDGDAWLAGTLSRVARTDGPERGYSFAVFADIQVAYDELEDCVRRVNADSSIRFVVVAGDLTQYGLLREFEWVRDALNKLNAPYLPVLGNHDALANGPEIFRRLFGPSDYSFHYRGTRFVVFNDNAWEFETPVPDLERLDSAMATPDSLRLIPIAHIPPWADQLGQGLDTALTKMMMRHRAILCIFAHNHHFRSQLESGERSPYVVVDNIADRNYARVTLHDSTFSLERIFF